MRLPCLAFKIRTISRNGSEFTFRAHTRVLGAVDIKTRQNLTQLDSLYLVHPWIDFLLDRRATGYIVEMTTEGVDDRSSVLGEPPWFPGPSNITSPALQTRAARLIGRLERTFGGRPTSDAASLLSQSTESPMEKRMHILQFIARLRQPFGALLLASTRQNAAEYRRIATESVITVQVEITPATLDGLIRGVRVLDVL